MHIYTVSIHAPPFSHSFVHIVIENDDEDKHISRTFCIRIITEVFIAHS